MYFCMCCVCLMPALISLPFTIMTLAPSRAQTSQVSTQLSLGSVQPSPLSLLPTNFPVLGWRHGLSGRVPAQKFLTADLFPRCYVNNTPSHYLKSLQLTHTQVLPRPFVALTLLSLTHEHHFLMV
jgi:hypothetical protein